MNNIPSIIFLFFMVMLMSGLTLLLFLSIFRNYQQSNKLRYELSKQLNGVSLKKLLHKEKIDTHVYLHQEHIVNLEKQIKKCQKCGHHDSCEKEWIPSNTITSIARYCPNYKVLKKYTPEKKQHDMNAA